MPEAGIVVIGRNEGQRLVNCLNRLKDNCSPVVYVDSGSTDASVKFARSMDIPVIELDNRIPFSAARARNEGFFHLIKNCPELAYVQFIDGDSELVEGWLAHAQRELDQNPDWAVVCGRRKERYPEKSVYTLLCDMEWDTPIGQARASGGDFMIRAAAFQAVNGFNSSLIAGEEPELGFRLREKGWKIRRLDHPMTIHDADITRFFQWWEKMRRSGYAYIQGFALHGFSHEKYYMRETLRPWLWVCAIPLLLTLATYSFSPASLICFLAYPLQIARVTARRYQHHGNLKLSFFYAFFNMIGKLPELTGQIQFILLCFLKDNAKLIEYK